MLTIGSLFSGIGGLELGLERAGLGPVIWQAESGPYARKVLARHWPGVPIYEDVRDIDERAPRPDLICGGFPCQPVSRSGRRRAQADERWLWPEYARIVRILRPRYAFVENVPGLLDGGIGDVLRDLAALGFDAEWDVAGACAVGGTMHRERVWLLAYADDEGLQGPVWAGQPDQAWQAGQAAHSEPLRSACGFWPPGPGALSDSPRMADGPANRAHRLRVLGNAVVPQVSEWIGRRIVESLQMGRA
jgi:DNA (cytosine-5)-methyltransferase 1